MGNETPSLKKLIDNSLAELTRAQDIAERTARPQNVCAGHDALFALTRAVASGVATSLSVSAGRLSDAEAMPQVAALLDQRLPADVPRIILHGQVCRRELAVEIDGVHA